VVLWDARRHVRLTDKPLTIRNGGNVFGVTFSPDSSTIAIDYRRSPSSGVSLWDARRYTQLADRPLEAGKFVNRVFFSPDGKTLAAGYGHFDEENHHAQGGVAMWHTPGLAPLADRSLAIAGASPSTVAFSADGSTIAATYHQRGLVLGSGGRNVVLWDARSGLQLVDRPHDIAGGFEGDLTFSPDGKTLAVAYERLSKKGVVLWDVPMRRRVAEEPLDVADGSMTSMTFSPDGKTLAVGYRNMDSSDGIRISPGGVLLFDLDPESWKERASRIANRNLTREEWRLFLPEIPYHATFDKLAVAPEPE